MLTQTTIKVPAIIPADNTKYKCLSFFLFPFFLLSLNWERERERESIQWQYLGRVEGENGFTVYLAFSTDFFAEYFLWRASGILWGSAWRCLQSPVQELYFASSPRVLATASIHLVTTTAVLKPGSAFSPGAVATVSTPLVMPIAVLTTAFFIPISADEKGASGFRVLTNHLASFFFLRPVRRFVRTTIYIYLGEVTEYR